MLRIGWNQKIRISLTPLPDMCAENFRRCWRGAERLLCHSQLVLRFSWGCNNYYVIQISVYILGWRGGGSGDPYIFLHISSSWVKIRLHTENQLPGLSGSALKDWLGWVGGVGWGGVGWGGGPTDYFVTLNLSWGCDNFLHILFKQTGRDWKADWWTDRQTT